MTIFQNKSNMPDFVRELANIRQAIQWGRLFINANPVTLGGLERNEPDVTAWTHLTSPPPVDQADMVLIKPQQTLYTVAVGHFCFTGDGDIYVCTDATAGALVWELIGGAGVGTPATALNDLTDVTLVALADGEVLTYNAGSGQWENLPPSAGLFGLGVIIVDSEGGGDFTTIQAAMATAVAGNQIWVFNTPVETASFAWVDGVSVALMPGSAANLGNFTVTLATGVDGQVLGPGSLESGRILLQGTATMRLEGVALLEGMRLRPEGTGRLALNSCWQPDEGFADCSIWDTVGAYTSEVYITNCDLPGLFLDIGGTVHIYNSRTSYMAVGNGTVIFAENSTIYGGIVLGDTCDTTIRHSTLQNLTGDCLSFSGDQASLIVSGCEIRNMGGGAGHDCINTLSVAFTGSYLITNCNLYAASGATIRATVGVPWANAPFYNCTLNSAPVDVTFDAGVASGSNTIY